MSARSRYSRARRTPWWWGVALIAAIGAWLILDAWAAGARPLCGPP